MRRIEAEERRSRLGVRHHLASPAPMVESVAGDLVGLHSSDPVTVYLSARARMADFEVPHLEDALYRRRSLVRMLGMRRTMFVVPLDLAAVMDAACTRALAPKERRRLVVMVEEQGLAVDGTSWVEGVEWKTLEALTARGEATAAELTRDVEELGLQLSFGEGKTWAGTVGISTRLLFLLATEGRIVRGRPLGSWRSSQYRWASTERWLEGGIDEIEPEPARAELARRWLRTFGPATLTDMKWWTGWTVAQSRATLSEIGAVEVELDEGTGYVLADDLESPPSPGSWVALLPGLDATVMGWKERRWFLGDHQSLLFDRNGNAGPTVWWDGRIVGGWAQRPAGEVVVSLLEELSSEAEDMIAEEAKLLSGWLGDARITPRFQAPLAKELAAGGR